METKEPKEPTTPPAQDEGYVLKYKDANEYQSWMDNLKAKHENEFLTSEKAKDFKSKAIGEFTQNSVFKHLEKKYPDLHKSLNGEKQIERVLDFLISNSDNSKEQALTQFKNSLESEFAQKEADYQSKISEKEQKIQNMILGYEKEKLKSGIKRLLKDDEILQLGFQTKFESQYEMVLDKNEQIFLKDRKTGSPLYSKTAKGSELQYMTLDEVLANFTESLPATYRSATHAPISLLPPKMESESQITAYFSEERQKAQKTLAGEELIEKLSDLANRQNKAIMDLRNSKK